MNVLLAEPDYPNKFPPLGLLKIGTYHTLRGDRVTFVKGLLRSSREHFDRIYVSTLFSFYHDKTIRTILHYKRMVDGNLKRIFVGGIYATLNPNTIFNETGIYPVVGLLDRPGVLGHDNITIDTLIPAYELVTGIDHAYGLQDAFFGYSTRGCPNRCPFCAVPTLEPQFQPYIDIKPYIRAIREKYGDKTHLVLMDNNVLASPRLADIVHDIKTLGFERGAKLNRRKRTVDFNQGLDARRVTPEAARLLADIAAEPLRLAYDTPKEHKVFERAVRALHAVGLTDLSTYVLYNYKDTPSDLYVRLRHAVELNEELGTSIYSFPMRYTPLDARDRKHVGPHWTAKHIRGLQCILNVTKGLVSHRKDLFIEAFGDTPEQFDQIVLMPDDYILNRFLHKNRRAKNWRTLTAKLDGTRRKRFMDVIGPNNRDQIASAYRDEKDQLVRKVLKHYVNKEAAR